MIIMIICTTKIVLHLKIDIPDSEKVHFYKIKQKLFLMDLFVDDLLLIEVNFLIVSFRLLKYIANIYPFYIKISCHLDKHYYVINTITLSSLKRLIESDANSKQIHNFLFIFNKK